MESKFFQFTKNTGAAQQDFLLSFFHQQTSLVPGSDVEFFKYFTFFSI
jgi:hypothetical protein